VKSYDLAKACEELAHFLPSDTRIVSVQNGIGFEEILTQKFGAERVYYAVITHSLAVLEPGVVTVSPAAGGITFCGHVRTSPLQELMNLFNDLGVQLQRHDDYRNVKWSKLLIGNLGNASSAITDYPSTNLFKNPQVFVPELEAYRECLKVMKAQDIPRVDLPGYPASFLRPMASQLPPWLVYPLVRGKLTGPQMPWSVLRLEMEKARRTSEIDHLNGAVVHFGKKWRVPTPKNEFLCEMMQSIIGDKMPWGTYKHKIDAFSVDFTRFKGR
jgi:2-dehydropantoate 2-reductase